MRAAGDPAARFAAAVAARLGLRVELERAAELARRRAAARKEPMALYLDRLDAGDAAELAALAGELTVGETYFLRHIEQFRAFVELVAPDRLARGPLRVLSAGCASGEEPYTLAMLLHESLPGAPFAIHAIDLDPAAIARARAGRYSRWSLRAISPAFEQRWFRRDGRDVIVAPEIRAAVTFDRGNLFDTTALDVPGAWDVVFCRNVIMYFTDERAAAAITRIAQALAPGGYLFLGHAETLRDRSESFALRHDHGAFYYQRRSAAPLIALAGAGAAAEVPFAETAADGAGWVEDIRAATERVHAMVDSALAAIGAPR